MKRQLPVLILLSFAVLGNGQTLAEYLKLRRELKITQAVGVEALETLVGARIVEVRGTVKGSMKVGETTSLMLEKSNGGTMVVEGLKVPDWLEGNEVPARLLVRAERSNENSEVRARLIGAAPENDIARIEARAKPPVKKAGPKKGSREIVIPPGNGGLRGPIGRGGGSTSRRGGTGSAKEWIVPASEAIPYYAGFIKGRNRRLSNAEALRIAQGVIGFSLRYGVDARLIMAMVMAESGFNPGATSKSGAQGLGQLMPGTARGMGINNAYDSISNLYGTVRLVRGHLERYTSKTGDSFRGLVLALAAYNAGSGAVKRHGGVPPYKETQRYIGKVIGIYRALRGR